MCGFKWTATVWWFWQYDGSERLWKEPSVFHCCTGIVMHNVDHVELSVVTCVLYGSVSTWIPILALSAAALRRIILDPPFLPVLIYQQRTPRVDFRGQSKGIAWSSTSDTHEHTLTHAYLHTHIPLKTQCEHCWLRRVSIKICIGFWKRRHISSQYFVPGKLIKDVSF